MLIKSLFTKELYNLILFATDMGEDVSEIVAGPHELFELITHLQIIALLQLLQHAKATDVLTHQSNWVGQVLQLGGKALHKDLHVVGFVGQVLGEELVLTHAAEGYQDYVP